MASDKNGGLINIPSKQSVDETVEKLKGILQLKGITLFALVDHSGEAAKAGMKMRPTKLLIFGNPKAGAPVMKIPLGRLGRVALALIGKLPAEEQSSNLYRLKEVLETGRITDTSYSVADKYLASKSTRTKEMRS